jgi:acetoin:2,6-dichlorophenolindophenol oxidoreductase subunit beta
MAKLTYRQAITKAIGDELRSDPDVIFFGEDIAEAGGAFKLTVGLVDEFGTERVRDTPISEQAIIGAALGASISGLRPVAELMFADFIPVAMDQIVNQVAKYRYMSDGQFTLPLTIRSAQGGGAGFASQHSGCGESWLMQHTGLLVAVPSTPRDVYGLLRGAIREDNPVYVLEHKMLFTMEEEIPDDQGPMELGKAAVRREGSDVTIVATQLMMHRSLEAAAELEKEGISVEVVDPRTMVPLDTETILESLAKTNRLVIVEEAVESASWGGDIASLAANEGIYRLEAPVKRINLGRNLIPYSPPLEDSVIPTAARIAEGVREVMAG